jgi:uncharacterized protein YdbL (DUF1318 family)
MKPTQLVRLALMSAVLACGLSLPAAEALGPVKARMEKRLSAVDAMKDRGVVGEGNRGLLEVRAGATAADERIVSEENADRRAVYAAIAAQTGESAETVAAKRAARIAASARSGHWVQDAAGGWSRR